MSSIEKLSFKLEAFEGPLDLLLTLISKHKLNIYDIEITTLLSQYMEYMDALDEADYDSAGDFLAMAARLVYIKTCSLLPQAEEAQEMKKELEGELIEYAACKAMAKLLKEQCIYGEVFVRPPEKLPVNKTFSGNMQPELLVQAYMGMTEKARRMKPIKAQQFSPIVSKRIVTVTSKIIFVLKKLYKTGLCGVEELYEGVSDKSARVATFLAVLELTKSGRIFLNEDNTEIIFNRNHSRKRRSEQEQTEDLNIREQTDSDLKLSDDDALESDFKEEEMADTQKALNDDEQRFDAEKTLQIKREKYALESIRGVYKAFTAEPEGLKSESFEDAGEQACTHIKINRFSFRYRWGSPDCGENCWSCWRQRL